MLVLVVLMTSCEQSENFFFEQDRAELNIWLGSASTPQDSVSFNFSHMLPGRDSIMFNYRLLSYPLAHDVDFELEALDGDIDLVSFSLPTYIIKAGSYQGQFPIYFDKPDNYNEFKDRAGKLRFRLKENEVLKKGVQELSTLSVIVQNGLSKPDHWDVAPLYYGRLSNYFGTYSPAKHSLLIQLSGKTVFRVYTSVNVVTSEDADAMSLAQARALAAKCKKWLLEYQERNGKPLREMENDENSNLVIFP